MMNYNGKKPFQFFNCINTQRWSCGWNNSCLWFVMHNWLWTFSENCLQKGNMASHLFHYNIIGQCKTIKSNLMFWFDVMKCYMKSNQCVSMTFTSNKHPEKKLYFYNIFTFFVLPLYQLHCKKLVFKLY